MEMHKPEKEGTLYQRTIFCPNCLSVEWHAVVYIGFHSHKGEVYVHHRTACYNCSYVGESEEGDHLFKVLVKRIIPLNDWAALVQSDCFQSIKHW